MSAIDFRSEAEALFDYTRSLRRDFHRHPELGIQEHRSAAIVARELRSFGLEVTEGVGQTGVVGVLRGASEGPTVLVRADMDALPIQEETGAEYASENPGVMHACGHDGHMAMGLTVARLLAAHRDALRGTVKFVFQPAEEGLGGAEGMVNDGVLEGVDYALAMHLWNEKPVGWLGIADGPTMAAADRFQVRIVGKGGHGAQPQATEDPVLAASQVVTALQSIVSRHVDPLEAAVVSVTMFQAGTAFNIIPTDARLEGTIRTFAPEVTREVRTRFHRTVHGVAQAMGCRAEVALDLLTPAVINDPRVAALVRTAATEALPDAVIDAHARTMGSEDMALMMYDIPGCYFFVGSNNPAKGLDAPHHHPRFDFDEAALPRGVAVMSAAVVKVLEERPA
ncbi:MAG TPA: amidohydrolase [Chloroflexi bacterium]|nr:amidohydrolase [Chloroflexota bacterium]